MERYAVRLAGNVLHKKRCPIATLRVESLLPISVWGGKRTRSRAFLVCSSFQIVEPPELRLPSPYII